MTSPTSSVMSGQPSPATGPSSASKKVSLAAKLKKRRHRQTNQSQESQSLGSGQTSKTAATTKASSSIAAILTSVSGESSVASQQSSPKSTGGMGFSTMETPDKITGENPNSTSKSTLGSSSLLNSRRRRMMGKKPSGLTSPPVSQKDDDKADSDETGSVQSSNARSSQPSAGNGNAAMKMSAISGDPYAPYFGRVSAPKVTPSEPGVQVPSQADVKEETNVNHQDEPVKTANQQDGPMNKERPGVQDNQTKEKKVDEPNQQPDDSQKDHDSGFVSTQSDTKSKAPEKNLGRIAQAPPSEINTGVVVYNASEFGDIARLDSFQSFKKANSPRKEPSVEPPARPSVPTSVGVGNNEKFQPVASPIPAWRGRLSAGHVNVPNQQQSWRSKRSSSPAASIVSAVPTDEGMATRIQSIPTKKDPEHPVKVMWESPSKAMNPAPDVETMRTASPLPATKKWQGSVGRYSESSLPPARTSRASKPEPVRIASPTPSWNGSTAPASPGGSTASKSWVAKQKEMTAAPASPAGSTASKSWVAKQKEMTAAPASPAGSTASKSWVAKQKEAMRGASPTPSWNNGPISPASTSTIHTSKQWSSKKKTPAWMKSPNAGNDTIDSATTAVSASNLKSWKSPVRRSSAPSWMKQPSDDDDKNKDDEVKEDLPKVATTKSWNVKPAPVPEWMKKFQAEEEPEEKGPPPVPTTKTWNVKPAPTPEWMKKAQGNNEEEVEEKETPHSPRRHSTAARFMKSPPNSMPSDSHDPPLPPTGAPGKWRATSPSIDQQRVKPQSNARYPRKGSPRSLSWTMRSYDDRRSQMIEETPNQSANQSASPKQQTTVTVSKNPSSPSSKNRKPIRTFRSNSFSGIEEPKKASSPRRISSAVKGRSPSPAIMKFQERIWNSIAPDVVEEQKAQVLRRNPDMKQELEGLNDDPIDIEDNHPPKIVLSHKLKFLDMPPPPPPPLPLALKSRELEPTRERETFPSNGKDENQELQTGHVHEREKGTFVAKKQSSVAPASSVLDARKQTHDDAPPQSNSVHTETRSLPSSFLDDIKRKNETPQSNVEIAEEKKSQEPLDDQSASFLTQLKRRNESSVGIQKSHGPGNDEQPGSFLGHLKRRNETNAAGIQESQEPKEEKKGSFLDQLKRRNETSSFGMQESEEPKDDRAVSFLDQLKRRNEPSVSSEQQNNPSPVLASGEQHSRHIEQEIKVQQNPDQPTGRASFLAQIQQRNESAIGMAQNTHVDASFQPRAVQSSVHTSSPESVEVVDISPSPSMTAEPVSNRKHVAPWKKQFPQLGSGPSWQKELAMRKGGSNAPNDQAYISPRTKMAEEKQKKEEMELTEAKSVERDIIGNKSSISTISKDDSLEEKQNVSNSLAKMASDSAYAMDYDQAIESKNFASISEEEEYRMTSDDDIIAVEKAVSSCLDGLPVNAKETMSERPRVNVELTPERRTAPKLHPSPRDDTYKFFKMVTGQPNKSTASPRRPDYDAVLPTEFTSDPSPRVLRPDNSFQELDENGFPRVSYPPLETEVFPEVNFNAPGFGPDNDTGDGWDDGFGRSADVMNQAISSLDQAWDPNATRTDGFGRSADVKNQANSSLDQAWDPNATNALHSWNSNQNVRNDQERPMNNSGWEQPRNQPSGFESTKRNGESSMTSGFESTKRNGESSMWQSHSSVPVSNREANVRDHIQSGESLARGHVSKSIPHEAPPQVSPRRRGSETTRIVNYWSPEGDEFHETSEWVDRDPDLDAILMTSPEPVRKRPMELEAGAWQQQQSHLLSTHLKRNMPVHTEMHASSPSTADPWSTSSVGYFDMKSGEEKKSDTKSPRDPFDPFHQEEDPFAKIDTNQMFDRDSLSPMAFSPSKKSSFGWGGDYHSSPTRKTANVHSSPYATSNRYPRNLKTEI